MNARVGIAVDSSCDLSAEFIRQHGIEVLPIYVNYRGGSYHDNRDTQSMRHFYQHHDRSRYELAQTEPVSVDEMTSILQKRFLPKYDKVQVITINSAKSQVYNRVSQAALINEPRFRALKKQAPDRPPFRIRLCDSTSMFTGHAVLVKEFVRLFREEGKSLAQANARIDALRDNVFGYMIPRDLSYMRERRKLTKGDHNISWFSYKMSEVFNIRPIIELHRGQTRAISKSKGFEGALRDLFALAKQAIDDGLACNTVVMSYGGLLDEIAGHSLLLDFKLFARKHGVDTMLSMMSTTAAVNVGPRAFSLAFAAGGN